MKYKGYTVTMIDGRTWRVITPDGSVYGWYHSHAAAQHANTAQAAEPLVEGKL